MTDPNELHKGLETKAIHGEKQGEIQNAFKEEYFGFFDDGNHPGGDDMLEAKDLEKKTNTIENESTNVETNQEQEPLDENTFLIDEDIDPEIHSWLEANQHILPRHLILDYLKNYQTVSCELCRRPKTTGQGRIVSVGPPLGFEDVGLGRTLSQNNEPLPGNIAVYITFHPIAQEPLTVKISSKIVEYPDQSKGDFINKGIVFQNTLNGKEFEEELEKAKTTKAA